MDTEYDSYVEKTNLPSDFSVLEHEKFDPKVWGPHYWFFLHTVAHTYPLYPNEVTKRKYYDLINNMPLFIPNEKVVSLFLSISLPPPTSNFLPTFLK